MGDYLLTSARQGKVQESPTFGHFSTIFVCFVVLVAENLSELKTFVQKCQTHKFKFSMKIWLILPLVKFTLDSKNVSFVHI